MVDKEILEKALIFAEKAHFGQTRKGSGQPYITHPISVMNRITKNKKTTNLYLLQTVAILHDVVEDCNVSIETIADEFGYQVASIVDELTLNKDNYKKIGKKEYLAQEMLKMSSYALSIKLCDRLDNITDMKTMGEKFQRYYISQTEYILSKIKERKLTATQINLVEEIKFEMSKY